MNETQSDKPRSKVNPPRECSNCQSECWEKIDPDLFEGTAIGLDIGAPTTESHEADFIFMSITNHETGYQVDLDLFKCRECGAVQMMARGPA